MYGANHKSLSLDDQSLHLISLFVGTKAVEMEKRGLHFSAVHDSYWTHPCDVEEMNSILRESFIELYNRPLLEELKNTWEMRYPSITFPDIPAQGDLDLNDVRSAPYFFQ